MAFLDEEEELPIDEPLEEPPQRGGRRPPRSPRQQILVRRLMAAGGAVLILILLVIGVKGCLNARKERAIRGFISDTSALVDESNQVGQDFFGILSDPGGRSPLEYETQIKSFRGAAESQYDRAKSLSAPGDMGDAKQAIVTTMQLRRNGLATIGDEIHTALGKENAVEAQTKISDQIGLLYASDQVYTGIALPEISAVVNKDNVTGVEKLPTDTFVPVPATDWLDPAKITTDLSQVSGTTATTPGTHGLELVKTAIGDTTLQPGVPSTVSSQTPQLNVEVRNGGDSEERDVQVTVTVGGTDLSTSVPSIGAGETVPVKIPISPVPPSGEQLTVQVTIAPVPGETLTDNNSSTYTVTFQ